MLISSAGRRGALVRIFQRALRAVGAEGEVLAADASPLSAAGVLADDFVVVPRCTDDEFVPQMRKLCREREISLIIPTIDPELPVYAANRAEFAEIGTTVLISAPEAVAIAGDKLRTHQWFVGEGFPTVPTVPLSEALADPDWGYPTVVKPARGSASLGVALVPNRRALEARAQEPDMVAQAVAPGLEFTADAWVDQRGRCRCVVLRRRLEVRAGESSKGMTVRNPVLQDLVTQVVEALTGAYGAVTVQLFAVDRTANLIELNLRFGGGFPLAFEAGARYPVWILEELLSLPSTAQRDAWRDGLVMLRYDEAVFVDATAVGL